MSGAPVDIDRRLARIVPGIRTSLLNVASRRARGRVRRVIGCIVHASLEEVRVGELCELVDPSSGSRKMAEVVGIADDCAVLVPLGDSTGLSRLTEVIATGREHQVSVGAGLLGRVVSAMGLPLDGRPLPAEGIEGRYPVDAYPPLPLGRSLISEPIQLGIRAMDGLLTCTRGQRIGMFGEPGVGKTILLSQMVGGTDSDVVVVALVGERGREVREFVERHIGPNNMSRTVVVAATSDRPAIERVKAALVATSIAEYFRDQGKHVLLAMDNITRFARAQREIGLAAGEPPTRRGFPPSLFAVLPRLIERSGPGPVGSITGLYSVLMEGDGAMDPVAEEIKALLDGHVFLSNDLAQQNHFPAIDVPRSRSRLMDGVVTPTHRAHAARLRQLLARYAEIELLVRIGEYEDGTDPVADEAIAKIDKINAFLRQSSSSHEDIASTQERMREIVNEGV